MTWHAARLLAIYSASILDKATVSYFFDDHIIGLFAIRKTFPDIDL